MPDFPLRRPLVGLDRYTAPYEDSVPVARLYIEPYSGPRRAERAKRCWPTSRGALPRISRGRAPWLVFVCGVSVAVGCGAPNEAVARIEPTYDPATGRLQLLKYDANGDGRVDTWSYMDGAMVVRIEIDADHDGTLDRWEHYGADGAIEKVGSSRWHDGNPDSWAYYAQDGSIARLELSTHRDGKVDRIEYYQKGVLVRAEEDTGGDGRIDKWEAYEGSRLTSVSFDTTDTGRPDRQLTYLSDGSVRAEALTPSPAQQ